MLNSAGRKRLDAQLRKAGLALPPSSPPDAATTLDLTPGAEPAPVVPSQSTRTLTVYDYFLDEGTGAWRTWEARVQPWSHFQRLEFYQQVCFALAARVMLALRWSAIAS
jgi:hypothetical protein